MFAFNVQKLSRLDTYGDVTNISLFLFSNFQPPTGEILNAKQVFHIFINDLKTLFSTNHLSCAI